MSPFPSRAARLSLVFAYAVAMAWVESAVVFYLRTMVHRLDPYQPDPLPLIGGLGPVELVREAATLIMLLAVGLLAGRAWRTRLAYAAFAFGVWDLFYYLFLKVICGWPHSLLDWDILFLLPLPWWGPVLAPLCIALLMILWGALASREEETLPVLAAPSSRARTEEPIPRGHVREWTPWGLNALGICLALSVFMADAFRVSGQGVEVVRKALPRHFHWPLFCLALALMAAPILSLWVGGRSEPGARAHGRGRGRASGTEP